MSETCRKNAPTLCKFKKSHVLINTTSLVPSDLKRPPSGTVAMIARVDRSKDHLYFSTVLRHTKSVEKVVFAGSGTEVCEFKKIFSRHINIEFEFLGSVSDIQSLLLRANVLCLFSKFEALPISLIEGMSQGLPLIASDVGSVSEIIENGRNGFLSYGDPIADAKKLDHLIMHGAEFAINSYQFYLGKFSKDRFDFKVREILNDV